MALRTIADLPALDAEKINENPNLTKNVSESIFEISYMENIDRYDSYKSRHVKFKGLSSLMMNSIINNDFDFHGHKTFWSGIGISGYLDLSGNLLVNDKMLKDEWYLYNTVINTGNTTLNSINMLLCSEQLTIYTDIGQIKNYNNDITLVNWDANNFNINVLTNIPIISCNSISASGNSLFNGHTIFNSTTYFNGVATFRRDIQGCAISARWADLAELYKSDADYEPGTLVKFGGSAEITIANDSANAVITKNPGFILNTDENKSGIYKGIALVGRTPVKVMGPVKKFDRLKLNNKLPGTAKKIENVDDTIIAIAFEDIIDNDILLIECVVLLTLN